MAGAEEPEENSEDEEDAGELLRTGGIAAAGANVSPGEDHGAAGDDEDERCLQNDIAANGDVGGGLDAHLDGFGFPWLDELEENGAALERRGCYDDFIVGPLGIMTAPGETRIGKHGGRGVGFDRNEISRM